MIIIEKHIILDIIEHANGHSPLEACGLLAGSEGDVKKIYRLTNVDGSPEHFSLDPKEQFAAVKDARRLGYQILAVYHSHPATPARMSQEDLRLAVAPGMQYVIVSLMDEAKPQVRCFTVEDGQPVEQQVLIQE